MSANQFEGPEAEKPEWFSIVEADTRVRHNVRDRRFRLMALAGPLLLISTGLLFAQASGSHNASATEGPSVSSTIASGSTELATSTDIGVATNAVAINPPIAQVAQSVSSPVAVPTVTNKETAAIAQGQGFVPPIPAVSPSSSTDDDSVTSDEEDSDSEGTDEGDDD